LLKNLQKFSRFLSTTIFIPAENTRHPEKHGQNPAVWQNGDAGCHPALGR
jgi:hypothetical protein